MDEVMCEFCDIREATSEVRCGGVVLRVCDGATCQGKADDECSDVIIGTDYEERV